MSGTPSASLLVSHQPGRGGMRMARYSTTKPKAMRPVVRQGEEARTARPVVIVHHVRHDEHDGPGQHAHAEHRLRCGWPMF